MKIDVNDVRNRQISAHPVLFVNTATQPFPYPTGRSDLVWTFIAYGPLSYSNGLPALGEQGAEETLESGDVIHVLGDVKQLFRGVGGGTGQIVWWKAY